MSEMKKNLLIRMIITCLLSVLLGILLICLNGNLIVKVLSIVFGIMLICYGIFNAVISKNNTAFLILSILEIIFGFTIIFWTNQIMQIFAGIYLIALPIVEIILQKQNTKEAIKEQLPSIIFGIAIICFSVGTLVDILLTVTGWCLIIFAIIYLILGTISLSKHQ